MLGVNPSLPHQQQEGIIMKMNLEKIWIDDLSEMAKKQVFSNILCSLQIEPRKQNWFQRMFNIERKK